MRLINTHPIKKPKSLKKADKDKIIKILKENRHLLSKLEKRIYKKQLEEVSLA